MYSETMEFGKRGGEDWSNSSLIWKFSKTYSLHNASVSSVLLFNDTHFYSGSSDHTIKLTDLESSVAIANMVFFLLFVDCSHTYHSSLPL